MLIRCPECQFERVIEDATVPAHAAMATCPQCKTRFRFRNPDGTPVVSETNETPIAPKPHNTSPVASPKIPPVEDGDDPLPPGAVIPKIASTDSLQDNDPAGTQPPAAPHAASPEAKTSADVSSSTLQKKTPPASSSGSLSGWLKKLFNKAPSSAQETPPENPEKKLRVTTPDEDTGIPWEQAAPRQMLPALYHTMLQVLFAAPRFFSRLPFTYEGLLRPLGFYLIMGMFQILVERMWFVMRLENVIPTLTDPKAQEMAGDLIEQLSLSLTLLAAPAILVVQLLLFSGLFFLMFRLVQPEQTDFRTVFRVIAYSMAPAIVCIVPYIGSSISGPWFAVSCFIGCKYALRMPWSRVALALTPIYLVAFAISFQFSTLLRG